MRASNKTVAVIRSDAREQVWLRYTAKLLKYSLIAMMTIFSLEDASGNVALVGLGEEQNRTTKASQIIVGNTLMVDGIFIGDVGNLISSSGGNLPPDYSFLSTLPPTMPNVSW